MTDHNLDPAAVDAAAKHVYETDPEGMNALGFGEEWSTLDSDGATAAPYYRGLVTAAITAYQRHMAEQVREAVGELYLEIERYLDGWGTIAALAEQRAAFLRLVGAAETEAER